MRYTYQHIDKGTITDKSQTDKSQSIKVIKVDSHDVISLCENKIILYFLKLT